MATGLSDRLAELKAEVSAALCFKQPALAVSIANGLVMAEGTYYLSGSGSGDAAPGGPLTEYELRIEVPSDYPSQEPRVFETGGAIPEGQHLNPNGTCCTCVWEEWLARSADHSFAAFCEGPLRDYFLSQLHFKLTGEWPFGERAHGLLGVVEGCVSVLGIESEPNKVVDYLLLLQRKEIKGHWPCPCGSGEIIRKCHGRSVFEMRAKVPPQMATRMLDRMRSLVG